MGSPRPRKKPYTSPKLRVYGDLRRLTGQVQPKTGQSREATNIVQKATKPGA